MTAKILDGETTSARQDPSRTCFNAANISPPSNAAPANCWVRCKHFGDVAGLTGRRDQAAARLFQISPYE